MDLVSDQEENSVVHSPDTSGTGGTCSQYQTEGAHPLDKQKRIQVYSVEDDPVAAAETPSVGAMTASCPGGGKSQPHLNSSLGLLIGTFD